MFQESFLELGRKFGILIRFFFFLIFLIVQSLWNFWGFKKYFRACVKQYFLVKNLAESSFFLTFIFFYYLKKIVYFFSFRNITIFKTSTKFRIKICIFKRENLIWSWAIMGLTLCFFSVFVEIFTHLKKNCTRPNVLKFQ